MLERNHLSIHFTSDCDKVLTLETSSLKVEYISPKRKKCHHVYQVEMSFYYGKHINT